MTPTPLVKCANRRGLYAEFDRLVSSREVLTLVIVDLDQFKQYNDREGHAAGDKMLALVGDVLLHHAEQYGGICARMGGDEFAIVSHYTVENVQEAARRVRGWLLDVGVKASAGCSVFGRDGNDFDTCYRVADARLYAAKARPTVILPRRHSATRLATT